MSTAHSESKTLHYLAGGIILAALVAVIYVQDSQIRNLNTTKLAEPSPVPPAKITRPITAESSVRRARPRVEDAVDRARKEHLKSVETKLEQISRPMVEDMASTMFSAELTQGQSIVTGGFPITDGRSQFTILTPEKIRLADGTEAFQINAKIMALDSEKILSSGLNSLATQARNTLQHAEAWEKTDVDMTLEQLKNAPGSNLLTSPTITTGAGQAFKVEIGSAEEGFYSLEGTANNSNDGSGIRLQARIEQRDPPAPAP
jgi:hypothetical protein